MPHATHEPPSFETHDGGAATSTTAYRARIAGIDPDDVLRNVRRCNGFRSWSLAPREIYQLARCTVTVYEHQERAPELVLDGPVPDEIRNVLARLGFDPHDVINEPQPAEDSS